MAKLLHAGIRRYLKSIVFWLALAATVVIAILSGNEARQLYIDDVVIIAQLIVFAVMISWLVGREYDEGIFRNKIISGHTKGRVFLSELILGAGACSLMFLIYSAIFAAFNSYIFSVVPAGVLLRIFIDMLLVNLAIAVIFVTLSSVIPHRAIIGIVNILLIFGLMFAAYGLDNALYQPEYYTEYEYREIEYTEPDGTVTGTIEEIPGTGHQVKNKNYLDEPLRTPAQILMYILPTAHIETNIDIVEMNFGYDYFNNYPDLGLTYWTSQSSKFSITAEQDKALTVNIIYSIAFIAVFSAAGYLIFRKKDFK